MKIQTKVVLIALVCVAGGARAGQVQVLGAEFQREGADRWQASVTLRHGDTGWEHYADAWRVVSPDGAVYGVRTLYHPHEHEQPFTRSLNGIAIPAGTTRVFVEAHDKVHGWSPERLEVNLNQAKDGRVRAAR